MTQLAAYLPDGTTCSPPAKEAHCRCTERGVLHSQTDCGAWTLETSHPHKTANCTHHRLPIQSLRAVGLTIMNTEQRMLTHAVQYRQQKCQRVHTKAAACKQYNSSLADHSTNHSWLTRAAADTACTPASSLSAQWHVLLTPQVGSPPGTLPANAPTGGVLHSQPDCGAWTYADWPPLELHSSSTPYTSESQSREVPVALLVNQQHRNTAWNAVPE